ncbi:carbohydrate ABC transporter permease [Anaerococcus sp. ENR1011]|uniref:Carbohydrate ABC transporter permease n=1 Tax=Anaerococcus groningensis TaxID=3115616 RepID=A0ABW9N0R7_9FIRM
MREESILRKILRIIALIIVSVIFLGPFLWMVFTSFKPLAEALRLPPTFLPETWVPQNYVDAWNSGPFLHYTKNSIIVTLSVVALQLLTIIPASYAFAKMDFKGKNILFSLILVTMMIPAQLIFLPVYLMFSKANLINTYWSLILPWASSAFGIFLLRQRFMQVPDEIIEAAVLDNTPTWKIIFKIMLPQARGTVITIALLNFIGTWNDYFWPLVMTSNDDVRTLPLGVSMLKSTLDGIHWNTVMAGNVILILPIVIIYIFAQREIIKAFTYSGIK